MSAKPPAICPGCFTDRRDGDAAPCASCGRPVGGEIWEPFPGGARVWILRAVLAAIPGGIAALMLAGAARMWLGPPDPSLSPVLRAAFSLVGTVIGLGMLGVTNLILLTRRWDYRSADGRVTGWVQTLLGRVFEAKGTRLHASAVPPPPVRELDSAVLAEPWCGVALGLTMTVLGMAARSAVVLHVVERRELERAPCWPLCLGWLGARTVPLTSDSVVGLEISAAPGEREVRRLERSLLARLPLVEATEARSPDFRVAAAVVRAGAPLPLQAVLGDCVWSEGGEAAVRELSARDEATTRVTGEAAANQALAVCREAAPGLVDLVEHDARMAVASHEEEAETDAER